MGPAPQLRPAGFIHGDDGLGNVARPLGDGIEAVAEPAVDLLVRLTSERPRQVSVVAIGPLTNLGLAVKGHPGWAATVDELVVMGGSVTRGGNALPLGEANVAHDPTAAAIVVGAGWRRPPLLVGLDVTWVATLSEAEFDLVEQHRSAAAAFLDRPLRFYRRFGSTFTAPDTPCHDLLAVMALSDPAVLTDTPVASVGGRHGRRAGVGRHRGRSAGTGPRRPARLGPAPTGRLLRLADRPVGRCRAVSGRGSPPLRGR